METSYLKKSGVILRIAEHPLAAFLGGSLTAGLCGFFGAVHGTEAMVIMAVLGGALGASSGAMLAASNKDT
jgi:hypothetical protein